MFFCGVDYGFICFGLIWYLRLKWSVSEKVVGFGNGVLWVVMCAYTFGFY